jgi:nitroreductase
MCRSFTDEPVDPATVDRLLDLARRAPSAGHAQGWAWVVLEGAAQTARFWALDAEPAWLAAPTLPGLVRAPVILVPLSNPDLYRARYAEADKAGRGRPGGVGSGPGPAEAAVGGWPVPWWDVDLSFAVMLLLLGAVEAGLGALFFALHAEPAAVARGLGAPAGWRPLGAVALGRPAPDARPGPSASRGRRPQAEIVHRGGW